MTREETVVKAQAEKQALPMSCDDCCYEPNSPFCEMCRKDICEKKDERQTGKWIRVTDKTGHLVWECDKCGWQQRYNTNFCPDCGANMESEEKK